MFTICSQALLLFFYSSFDIKSTYTLLNYEFVIGTNKMLFYITQLQYSTYYMRPYLPTNKPCMKLLNCLQCATLLTNITYNTLHYLTYGYITYLKYVIFLTYTKHLHWKNCNCPYGLGGRLFSTRKQTVCSFQALGMVRLLVCQLISVTGFSVEQYNSTDCKIVCY